MRKRSTYRSRKSTPISQSQLDRMIAGSDVKIVKSTPINKQHPSAQRSKKPVDPVAPAKKPRSRRVKIWQNERQFMAACFDRIHGSLSVKWPELCMAHHVPNENSHRQPGIVAGIPDICIPLPRGPHPGCWIELKVNGNTPTEKQADMMAALRSIGHQAHWVSDDLDRVIRIVIDYMELPG